MLAVAFWRNRDSKQVRPEVFHLVLARAAQLMIEVEVSHLIVIEPHSARPIGVLSTLDVAQALAGFPERHPVT